jgi:HSP20 family protein
MSSLRREMDRFFDRFMEPRWDEADTMGDWWPRMDVAETKDAFVVKAEIPGVDQKDIHVSLQEQTLTVKGEKRQEREDKDEQYHRVERAYAGTHTVGGHVLVPARDGSVLRPVHGAALGGGRHDG